MTDTLCGRPFYRETDTIFDAPECGRCRPTLCTLCALRLELAAERCTDPNKRRRILDRLADMTARCS